MKHQRPASSSAIQKTKWMRIELTGAGKRFNREWIFRNFSFVFEAGRVYAITGPNGSGKSTLLQVIGGQLQVSEGKIQYENHAEIIDPEKAFQHLSFAAPYLEVIEEMTLLEFLDFHTRFKPLRPGYSPNDLVRIAGLEAAAAKQIRYYSSGMKQRVRLMQAFFSDTAVLLLDEPCSNLDKQGIGLYRQLINEHRDDRLVVISSNDPVEYENSDTVISITDYKTGYRPLTVEENKEL